MEDGRFVVKKDLIGNSIVVRKGKMKDLKDMTLKDLNHVEAIKVDGKVFTTPGYKLIAEDTLISWAIAKVKRIDNVVCGCQTRCAACIGRKWQRDWIMENFNLKESDVE